MKTNRQVKRDQRAEAKLRRRYHRLRMEVVKAENKRRREERR